MGILVLSAIACGSDAQKTASEASSKPVAKTEKSATASASSAPTTTASATATPSSSASAAGSASGAAAAPASLAALFDGAPDAAIAMKDKKTLGRATVGLPADWEGGGSWDSVDAFSKKGGAATFVVLRLDISEGLLDSNVATWVKVPFQTTEVKWEPREPAKFGAAQLEAKVAKGSGSIGKDEAEFWQIDTGIDDKKYGIVIVAGLKKSADAATRSELVAAVRSIGWK